MTDIILHHYPESPFAEKIRLILAYKNVPWHSVIIPVIMPKPDLTALTGGYRKTPVMQIGADVYCDTALIARVIDRLHPERPLYSQAAAASADGLAYWLDTFFFKVAVAFAFQPEALAANPVFSDPAKAAAFAADRAALTKGSEALRMPLEQAKPYFLAYLASLERQFQASDFLFGDQPLIADFSAYHCLWFVHGNAILREVFAPYAALNAWLERMRALGVTQSTELSGQEALAIAHAAQPAMEADVDTSIDGLAAGAEVDVTPIDYGFDPVRGELLVASLDEIAVRRSDAAAGELTVHFPRMGFGVQAA